MTHSKANLLSHSEVLHQLECHEREKKRQYAQMIVTVDRGNVSTLSTYQLMVRFKSRTTYAVLRTELKRPTISQSNCIVERPFVKSESVLFYWMVVNHADAPFSLAAATDR